MSQERARRHAAEAREQLFVGKSDAATVGVGRALLAVYEQLVTITEVVATQPQNRHRVLQRKDDEPTG